MMTQKRPEKSEYAVYYEKYVALVPGGDFLEILGEQHSGLLRLLSPLSEEQADFRYANGKWSIKETIGHLVGHCHNGKRVRVSLLDRTHELIDRLNT